MVGGVDPERVRSAEMVRPLTIMQRVVTCMCCKHAQHPALHAMHHGWHMSGSHPA